MALLMEIDYPGVTAEQYDEVQDTAGTRSGRPVPGLLGHLAVVTDDGVRVVDVWESREALEAYLPVILPATKAAGFPDAAPRLSEIHNVFIPR
ncbi:antibiotic biosynthesis monooxygenase family protein [Streptomyces lancefieldiae]|uniref:ABM domain-containing protein n=1 Tax=Streptomyces lancefieldiae TaxID=3075520 RepID=A0ABU3AMX1_9ACTN|nr:hypothetical protein [Streptomyces sp. DSM 40712]MDT0611541.1 hypothetical protein [Streptomyces sp. DSM 40712]